MFFIYNYIQKITRQVPLIKTNHNKKITNVRQPAKTNRHDKKQEIFQDTQNQIFQQRAWSEQRRRA